MWRPGSQTGVTFSLIFEYLVQSRGAEKSALLEAHLMWICSGEADSKKADRNFRRNVFFVNLGVGGVRYIDSAVIPPAWPVQKQNLQLCLSMNTLSRASYSPSTSLLQTLLLCNFSITDPTSPWRRISEHNCCLNSTAHLMADAGNVCFLL